ncbi:major facilitator superfamily domain-containing protein 10-like isoform X2 [Stegodyphus dumicola]|uniref:major facilitator superfamily domain-containing protein 10-like isoform X2 n=1 Tax=Stegodyphus dumicola TaxID=202533 RepID=UPI0015AF7FF7|nr:major facilitator superfamily domain-containing protein 10-like isoform X2 [Stegodyphus dumicola]
MENDKDCRLSKSCNQKIEDDGSLPSSTYIIFFILIIDLLGFTVILPLLPAIFEYYDSNEKDHLYHWMDEKVHYFQNYFGSPAEFNKVLFAGLLGSVFSTLQFLAAPIFGSISDVYGRKPVIIISMVGIAVSHAIWCFADYFYLFVIARIVGGLSRANISLSTAIVTDLCSEKKRGKGMALIGIAFAIGFIVGPMIGAVFASRAVRSENFYFLPAIFALVMAATDIVILIFCFKESLPKDKRASSIGQGLAEAYQFINPPSLFSFSPVIDIQPEVIQGGYVRRIPAGKEIGSAAVGAFLIIPAFVLIGMSKSIEVLYLGLALYAFASATVVPCLTTIASKFGSSRQKGTVLGIFRSLGSLARAFGPVVSAIAYWSLTPTVSYCIGGILLIVPLILILSLRKELSRQTVKED